MVEEEDGKFKDSTGYAHGTYLDAQNADQKYLYGNYGSQSSSNSGGDFMSSAVDGLYGGLKAANEQRAAANRAAAVQAAAEQAQRDAEAERHHDRGVQLGKNGNYDGAIAEFNQALDISEFAVTYCERGVCFHAKGNYEQAIADYTAAFKDVPENVINTLSPRILLNRGNAYTSLNRWTKAADDWNDAAWYKKSEEGKQAKKLLLEHKATIEAQRTAELREFIADEKAAKSGDANGMFNLGCDYYNGIGVKENHKKAGIWWRKAAKLGHKDAQTNIDNLDLPKPVSKLSILGAICGVIAIGVVPGFGFFRCILGAIAGLIVVKTITYFGKERVGELICITICTAVGAVVFGLIPGLGIFRLIVGAAIGIGAGMAIIDGEYPFPLVGACAGALAFGTRWACMPHSTGAIASFINIGGNLFGGAVVGLIAGFILGKIVGNIVLRIIFIVLAVVLGGFFAGTRYSVPVLSSLISKGIGAVTGAVGSVNAKNTVTVTADNLNMRAVASSGGRVVKELKKGDKLIVTGEAVDGWLPVKMGSESGWVSEDFVSGGNEPQN